MHWSLTAFETKTVLGSSNFELPIQSRLRTTVKKKEVLQIQSRGFGGGEECRREVDEITG